LTGLFAGTVACWGMAMASVCRPSIGPRLFAESGAYAAVAKFKIDLTLGDCETVPAPVMENFVPGGKLIIRPLSVVKVAASVTVNSIPHLFNAVPEVHGVTIISTTPAVANVDGSTSSPVTKNVFVHLGLFMTELIL
jgi:hypothetical protein